MFHHRQLRQVADDKALTAQRTPKENDGSTKTNRNFCFVRPQVTIISWRRLFTVIELRGISKLWFS
jgi:hypothetical protein